MKLVFGIEKRHIAAFALLLLCLSNLTLGQTTVTGGISGTVTDPSGAMVGGAKLTLKSVATGETTTTTSSATGDFQLPLLKPGDYTLIVSQDNFKSLTRTVTVLLGQNSTLNLALELGTGTTVIEVTSGPALLQTEDANLTGDDIREVGEEIVDEDDELAEDVLSAEDDADLPELPEGDVEPENFEETP